MRALLFWPILQAGSSVSSAESRSGRSTPCLYPVATAHAPRPRVSISGALVQLLRITDVFLRELTVRVLGGPTAILISYRRYVVSLPLDVCSVHALSDFSTVPRSTQPIQATTEFEFSKRLPVFLCRLLQRVFYRFKTCASSGVCL